METPIVSIIVPCYKQAAYLPEALESVLEQTYPYWECVVVNDASPDNTKEMALAYAERDARIFLLDLQKNVGLSGARNAGINATRGRFVLPLDADDKIHPDYLSKCVPILKKDITVKAIYTYTVYFGIANHFIERPVFSMKRLCAENIFHATALFRRSDFDNTSGYRTNMKGGYEDWDFWLQLLNDNNQAFLIPDYLFYYRKKENSMITDLQRNREKQNHLRNLLYTNNRKVFQKWHPELAYWYERKNMPGDFWFKIKYLIQSKTKTCLGT
jgi:glycosyltransferase involved in cell wall biosynthesis